MDDGQDFGGFLASLQGGAPQVSPQESLMAALNAPAPQVNMPERQAPDMSSIGPLAGLVLAASIAGRRAPGQSRVSQFLDGAVKSAAFAAQSKQDLEAQSSKRYAEDIGAMKAQQDLQRGAQDLETSRVQGAVAKASAPLQLDKLLLGVQNAKTEAEAATYTLKLTKAKALFADELAAAERDYATAKTDIAKSDAAARVTKANADMKEAEAKMVQAIAMKDKMGLESKLYEDGKKTGDIKILGEALPGQPQQVAVKDSKGQMLMTTFPMQPGDADLYLAQRYKQLSKEGLTTGSKEDFIKAGREALINPPEYRAWQKSKMGTSEGAGPDGKPLTPTAALNTTAAKAGVLDKRGVNLNTATNEFVDGQGMVLSKEAAAQMLNMSPESLLKKYPQVAKNPRYAAPVAPPIDMQKQAGQLYAAAAEGLRAIKAQEPGPYEVMRNPNAKAEWAARVAAVSAEVNRLQAAYQAASQGAP